MPSPAPSGYLPVDSFGASEIPWDEVGPGWFLVEWLEHPAIYGNSQVPLAPPDLSATLLAPDGTWYAAASLGGAGAEYTTFWLGDTLAMFHIDGVADGYDAGYIGHDVLVSLRDGSTRALSSDVYLGIVALAKDGSLVSAQFSEGGGGQYLRVDSAFNSTPLCGAGLQFAGSLSPDGVRFVCLGDDPAGSRGTIVSVSNVTGTGGTTVIDTFKSYPDSYSILGWFDADTFLLRRWAISESPDAYFTYNISTRKISEYALPVPLRPWVDFDTASQTFATRDYYSKVDTGVTFFSKSGDEVAHSACGSQASATYEASGFLALVTCRINVPGDWSTGTSVLSLIDLKSGEVVGTWTVHDDSEQSIQTIRGYP